MSAFLSILENRSDVLKIKKIGENFHNSLDDLINSQWEKMKSEIVFSV